MLTEDGVFSEGNENWPKRGRLRAKDMIKESKYLIFIILTLISQLFQKSFAGLEQVLEGGFKIPCVPRVCDIASAAGVRRHQMDLVLRVIGDYAAKKPEIRGIHTNEPVKKLVILHSDLPSCLGRIKSDAVLGKTTLGRRIDAIANLLCGNCCAFDVKFIFQTF